MDVEREPLGVRGGQDRPDLIVRNFSPNRHLAIDVGISHPLQKTWVDRGYKYKVLAAASALASTKHHKYQDLANADFDFRAATFESYGGASPDAEYCIKSISHFLKHERRESAAQIRNQLKQQLSLAMWTANAKLVLARVHMASQ